MFNANDLAYRAQKANDDRNERLMQAAKEEANRIFRMACTVADRGERGLVLTKNDYNTNFANRILALLKADGFKCSIMYGDMYITW